jgi:flavin-dependent dehydrogenase
MDGASPGRHSHDGSRAVDLTGPDGVAHRAAARVVLAADGLGGRSLARLGNRRRVAHGSRVGLGCVIDRPVADGLNDFAAGAIGMAVGAGGYVGTVRTETGSLNVAAAVDPSSLRAGGGPAAAVAGLLRAAGFPVPDALAEVRWHGTVPLTGRPVAVAGRRLFVLGDAAGYVEPFTGEGIAWALGSARAVAPLALRAVRGWDDSMIRGWTALHRRRVRHRQWACRAIAAGLRHPGLVRPVLGFLTSHPALATRVVRAVGGASVGGMSGRPHAEVVCR